MPSKRQTAQHIEVDQLLIDLRYLDLTGSVEYDSQCPIAQGGFGDIYKGRCRRKDDTECRVAIKRLRIYLDGGRDVTRVFRREIRAWCKLSHPNILPLAGYMLEETGGPSRLPSLVSEWMENGNILEFVKSNRDCDINRLAHGMAEGLAYLHANGVVHSDFKSGNVLISSTYEALISDFGAAHVSHDAQAAGISSTVTGTRGSCRWLAYELLTDSEQYQTATKESDTWSFGMTLLEVLTGDQPYSHLKRDGQVMFAITQKTLPSPPTTENLEIGSRSQLWEVCKSCWRWEPSQRPTMAVIALRLRAALHSKQQEPDPVLLSMHAARFSAAEMAANIDSLLSLAEDLKDFKIQTTESVGEEQDFHREDILYTLSNTLCIPDTDSFKGSKRIKGNLPRLLQSSRAKAAIDRITDLLEATSISNTPSTGIPDIVGARIPLMGSSNSSVNADGGGSRFELFDVLDPGTEPVYRAKALYSYKADPNDPNEVSFDKNDVLEILDKGGKWWQVRKADGTVGIAPSNYLLLLYSAQTVYWAKALYAYKADPNNTNEISFDKNDTLEILEKRGEWCQAKKANGPIGTVPSSYLQLI